MEGLAEVVDVTLLSPGVRVGSKGEEEGEREGVRVTLEDGQGVGVWVVERVPAGLRGPPPGVRVSLDRREGVASEDGVDWEVCVGVGVESLEVVGNREAVDL